jgi:hypothetical protein
MSLPWIRYVAAILILTVTGTAYPEDTSRKCTIKQFVGSVKVRRGTSAVWIDARPKMPVKETDALRTFMESEAELETGEGTILKVGENTTIELNTLKGTSSQQNTSVKIMNGALLANVKKLTSPASTFEFETPTATAAIRGTVVGLEVSKEQTNVKVYEGKVFVAPQGSKNGVELQQYQMGVVQKGGEKVAIQKFEEKSPASLSAEKSVPSSTVPVKIDSVKTDTTAARPVSDSAGAPVKSIDTAGQSMRSPASPVQLSLVVAAPAEGSVVAPSAQVPVSGSIKLLGASISVNGKQVTSSADGSFKTMVTAPASAGDMDIVVAAEYSGASKTATRRISVKSSPLVFVVSSPRDGQEFSKPMIPVSGTATAGAEVAAMSIRLPVTSSGTFSGQVPIPNEAGEHTLEFEASLNGTTQKISRRITFKPEFRFIVSSPTERQIVSSTTVIVKGDVLPVNAEVSVNGKKLPVSSSGQFSGFITIPDEDGEILLEFEIITGGGSKTESRHIVYKKPPDTNRPQLAASLSKGCWNITVFDRTADEEITLWYEIDGNKEFKTMQPNESMCISLENGVHTYRVYAEDKAKNLSATEQLSNYAYLSLNTWLIKMSKPAGNMTIDLPPPSPANEESIFPVEFTIENLPQDNMSLIREVSVTNKASGKRVTVRTFTDNFIATEINLIRERANLIQIDAIDINNVVKSRTVQINVQ